jgi:hypothetical protein
MKTKRNLALAALGVAAGVIVSLMQTAWSDRHHQPFKLEGPWIGRTQGTSTLASMYNFAPSDPSGRTVSFHASMIPPTDTTSGGLFPEAEYSGGFVGEAVVVESGRTDSRCKAVIALDPTYGPFTELNVPLLGITTPGENDTSLYTVATSEAIWFQLYEAIEDQARTDFYWATFEDSSSLVYTREVVPTMVAYELWFLNKDLKGETGPPLPLPGFPPVTGFKQK